MKDEHQKVLIRSKHLFILHLLSFIVNLQVLVLLLVLHCETLATLGTTTLEDLETILGLTPLQVSVNTETPAPTKLA